MNLVIHELRQDHHNMARLLVFMRNSVQMMKKSSSENHLRLLRNCIDYMVVYPDELHHPKEDILFNRLKERDSSVLILVENLQSEHQLLAGKTRELNEMIKAIESEQVVSQSQLTTVCLDYIESQFRHIRYEEDTIFPLIEQKLTMGDWKSIVRALPSGKDPLFNSNRSEFYTSFYRKIVESYQRGKN